MRRRALLLLCLAAGCGGPLVDGEFLGDATLRLEGLVTGHVADAPGAAVGAAWLGYAALFERAAAVETSVFPISSVRFPGRFTCDVLDPPPSSGRYAAADGTILPGVIRLGRLVVFDDVDGDGRFAVDVQGRLVPPDRLLARGERHALLFVARPPGPDEAPAAEPIVTNWDAAHPGFQVLALERAWPPRGAIVPRETPVELATSPVPEVF